jgi:Flp pilus assembly protein TadG
VILAGFSAALVVLCGFAALAVDVANGYVVRGMLQHAVDDGVRTAQRWSAQVDDPGTTPAAVQGQAVAAAIATAQRDLRAQGLGGTAAVNGTLTGSAFRLDARVPVPTWFLRVFGIASWSAAASSQAVLWTPASAAPLVSPGAPSEGADRSVDTTGAAAGPGSDTGSAGAGGAGGAGGGDAAEGW